MINGIDVSEHQGVIDWAKVNTGFVMIRAGYGREVSQKDKYFEANYSGCKSRGIPCGTYWYSYAVSPEEAVREAQVCLEAIKGKKFEFPVYFDIEEPRILALGMEKCSAIAEAFLNVIEKAGFWAGIYSSKYNLENSITEQIRSRYAVWVAHYGVTKTNYSGKFGIWQKSNKGSVAGISGNVDLDECYVDYPAEVKAAGLNGYDKSAAVPVKRTKKFTVVENGIRWSGTLTEE